MRSKPNNDRDERYDAIAHAKARVERALAAALTANERGNMAAEYAAVRAAASELAELLGPEMERPTPRRPGSHWPGEGASEGLADRDLDPTWRMR